jgi:hypothetical protein
MSRMSANVGASTSRNPKGLHGLYRDSFTLPCIYSMDIIMSKLQLTFLDLRFSQRSLKYRVIWIVTLCTSVEIYIRFAEMYHFHLHCGRVYETRYCHMSGVPWRIIIGFCIWWLDLLTPSFTGSINHTQLCAISDLSTPQITRTRFILVLVLC